MSQRLTSLSSAALAMVTLMAALLSGPGCRSYSGSTPSQVHEGDHTANYQRVFRAPVPTEVSVINSVVITYSFRPGVISTADFEFEVLAPDAWIKRTTKDLIQSDFAIHEAAQRQRAPIRPWYAPHPTEAYDCYRDATSVGYLHVLVQKQAEPDGRRRVFVSKH